MTGSVIQPSSCHITINWLIDRSCTSSTCLVKLQVQVCCFVTFLAKTTHVLPPRPYLVAGITSNCTVCLKNVHLLFFDYTSVKNPTNLDTFYNSEEVSHTCLWISITPWKGNILYTLWNPVTSFSAVAATAEHEIGFVFHQCETVPGAAPWTDKLTGYYMQQW